jgi:SAM-dependent methyltransferase
MAPDNDYVLGTNDAEIARLSLQHRVWRATALDAWMRAGIRAGAAVVDVGAGPGHATLDLAELVGSTGRVVGQSIDASDCDAAWCRWVACFVTSPAVLLANIRRALKTGGIAIFHEYIDYASWRFVPCVPRSTHSLRK